MIEANVVESEIDEIKILVFWEVLTDVLEVGLVCNEAIVILEGTEPNHVDVFVLQHTQFIVHQVAVAVSQRYLD